MLEIEKYKKLIINEEVKFNEFLEKILNCKKQLAKKYNRICFLECKESNGLAEIIELGKSKVYDEINNDWKEQINLINSLIKEIDDYTYQLTKIDDKIKFLKNIVNFLELKFEELKSCSVVLNAQKLIERND